MIDPERDDATREVGVLLRPELHGQSPYGAPQLDVEVALNTNENSYPVPPHVVEAISRRIADVVPGLNRYPDREFTALREDLAAYVRRRTGAGVDAAQVWAANGSNEVLQHLLLAFGGHGRVALGFTPSYSMYSVITRTTGMTWVEGHRGTGSDRYGLDAARVADQVRSHNPHVVFLCSPNNPTGTALDLDVVEAAYRAAPTALVVVDEAYAEFARPGTPSAVELLPGRGRLVVTRTMSKAFALAGARLGYLLADPALTEALRLVRLPYHLSSVTQATARASLAHADALLERVDAVKEQRDRIAARVAQLGLDVIPSDANFVLFGGLRDAAATWRELLERGVLVRDVGLPGHLRVTAGTPEETTTFLTALEETLAAEAAAQEDR